MRDSKRWQVRLLGGAGMALLPWMVVLALTLRDATGWVLLDLAEAASLVGTAALLRRDGQWHRVCAALAALLLVSDAGFDLGSATTGSDLWTALAMALGAELPLAALCAVLVLHRSRPVRALLPVRPVLALAA
ncbi:hypothetical protein [Kitasatospora viridis]|uniref:Uncharacterized protein n=1 Tax=Kitasatospora viridis TaxID=281105 RepID=A0A561ULC8_9ACTN|nr:hypothetical protein [Kitasatospora viridis]TWG00164.1 hypothetical protein FHX73_114033 [Kitasatospora viridis]